MRRTAIPRIRNAAVAAVVAWTAGCGPEAPVNDRIPRTGSSEISVLTWNLDEYRWMDRSGGGQATDPKPEEQRRAIVRLLRQANPDVAVFQDLGHEDLFSELRDALARAGLTYPHAAFHPADSDRHLALLSRYPIRRSFLHTPTYRIGAQDLTVLRGFLEAEIEIRPGRSLRILAAHLKSKTYHAAGQTEMRRNEARLLGGIARRALQQSPNSLLLLAGTLQDSPDSASLRAIRGDPQTGLVDLRPADALGDAWTWHDTEEDAWKRADYLLASPALAARAVPEKIRAIRHPDAAAGSRHRPLLAVFRLDES